MLSDYEQLHITDLDHIQVMKEVAASLYRGEPCSGGRFEWCFSLKHLSSWFCDSKLKIVNDA
jgi:hypothetical protein